MTNPIKLSDHRVAVNAQHSGDEPSTDTVELTIATAPTASDAADPATEEPAEQATGDDPTAPDSVTGQSAGENPANDVGEGSEQSGDQGSDEDSDEDSGTVRDVPTRRQVINTAQAQNTLPLADRPVNQSADDKPIAWLCGVHGGAGVSTLAEMLAPFRDSGGVIPAHDDPNTTILVAATHKSGLRAAHDAVLQFTSGNSGPAELLGVILVDHVPGKLPKSLAGDVERIREATPSHNVWHISYVPAWRSARLAELPAWSPTPPSAQKTTAAKLTRAQRKDRSDPLRHVPPAIAGDAQDMFDRAFTLYHRLNPPT
ncbi:DUF6668 family protein [Corynebacterium kalidii]